MTVEMTTQEYAILRGIWPDAVRKAIKLGHKLPGVTKREKFGKQHKLHVANTFVKGQKKYSKKVF